MLRTFALGLALAATPAQLAAQTPAAQEESVPDRLQGGAEAVVAVLRGERPAAEVFAPAFLAAVSEEQIKALTEQLAAQFGAVQGLESVTPSSPTAGTIAIRFEKTIARGPMQLDANGLVAGLRLNQFDPIDDSADKIAADLTALPGEASVYYAPLTEGAEPILTVDADAQFAIGSTFKLYILSALARQIAAGEHSWDEVVPLEVRSLPSGIAQNWPKGAPVTLHTLATLMISISDNTATDQLLAIVGREAVAEELRASGHSAPARTLPFLSTLELFGLKGDLRTRAGLRCRERGGAGAPARSLRKGDRRRPRPDRQTDLHPADRDRQPRMVCQRARHRRRAAPHRRARRSDRARDHGRHPDRA